jgi:uncharacterized protein (TIRG00374 family)
MSNHQSDIKSSTKNKSNLLSVILTLGVIFALVKYLLDNKEMFDSLHHLNYSHLLILVLLYFLFILVLSYLNKSIINKLDPNISTQEIVSLQFVNNFLNKILPKGGVAFRAMYLKNHYHLSYSYFLASFTGLVVVNLASQALVSLGSIYLIYLKTGLVNWIIVFGFLVILFGSFFVMIFKPAVSPSNNWILRSARRLVEGWKLVVDDPKDLLLFIIISMIVLLVDAFNMYIVFYALETPIQYSAALLLSSISIILSYINITPDGLGFREGIYIYISSIIAITETQILFGSLVQRAVSLLASLFFGSLSYILLKRSRKKSGNNYQH